MSTQAPASTNVIVPASPQSTLSASAPFSQIIPKIASLSANTSISTPGSSISPNIPFMTPAPLPTMSPSSLSGMPVNTGSTLAPSVMTPSPSSHAFPSPMPSTPILPTAASTSTPMPSASTSPVPTNTASAPIPSNTLSSLPSTSITLIFQAPNTNQNIPYQVIPQTLSISQTSSSNSDSLQKAVLELSKASSLDQVINVQAQIKSILGK